MNVSTSGRNGSKPDLNVQVGRGVYVVLGVKANVILPEIAAGGVPLAEIIEKTEHEVGHGISGKLTIDAEYSVFIDGANSIELIVNPVRAE